MWFKNEFKDEFRAEFRNEFNFLFKLRKKTNYKILQKQNLIKQTSSFKLTYGLGSKKQFIQMIKIWFQKIQREDDKN